MTAARSFGGVVGQGPLSNAARAVDVGGRRHRHLADVLAGGRAVHLDDFGGRRLRPLAADEEFVVFGFGFGFNVAHGRHPTQAKAKREHVSFSGLEHQHEIAHQELP
jgi:hypothetical protein